MTLGWLIGCLIVFYGISTLNGHLMPFVCTQLNAFKYFNLT